MECTIYNCFYRYVTAEKPPYSKWFDSETILSTEHAMVKLVDGIYYKPFEKDHYPLGFAIDLSEACDTVNHKKTRNVK